MEASLKKVVAKGMIGVQYLSNNENEYMVVYIGGGPSVGTDEASVASQFGLVFYNSGEESKLEGLTHTGGADITSGLGEIMYATFVGDDLIGHSVSGGLSAQLSGMENFYSQTRTLIVIKLPKISDEKISEIRYGK